MKTPKLKSIVVPISLIALSLAMIQCAQIPSLTNIDGNLDEAIESAPGSGNERQRLNGRLMDSDQNGEPDSIDYDEDGRADAALPGKVLLCHNDNNPHTIAVSPNAVDAHLRNHEGDCLGECPCESGDE
jgi:hypothetical protein